MVNWKSNDANLRLMAAILAAQPTKINLDKVALAYGRGATSRAIGHQISRVRELAKILNEEVALSRLTKPPRGAEQETLAVPRTPKAKFTESGGTTASRAGRGKRMRNAMEDNAEQLANSIHGSRFTIEQDGENIAELQDETPSKRARKTVQRPNLVANESSGTDEDEEGLRISYVESGYALNESSFVE